jgi:hypothetical protein
MLTDWRADMCGNEHPLNLVSLEALKHFQVDADPKIPYCLQLAQWLLKNEPQVVQCPACKFNHEILVNAHIMLN